MLITSLTILFFMVRQLLLRVIKWEGIFQIVVRTQPIRRLRKGQYSSRRDSGGVFGLNQLWTRPRLVKRAIWILACEFMFPIAFTVDNQYILTAAFMKVTTTWQGLRNKAPWIIQGVSCPPRDQPLFMGFTRLGRAFAIHVAKVCVACLFTYTVAHVQLPVKRIQVVAASPSGSEFGHGVLDFFTDLERETERCSCK